jgi:3'-5' exoribonuclease
MVKQFISDLKFGERVNSKFSVKYKHPPKEYKNGFMFTVGLADKTGEIEATYWGGKDEKVVKLLYDGFGENDVVIITGAVGEFRGRLRIDINEGDKIEKCTEYNFEDFVSKTDKDIEAMTGELLAIASSVKNSYLKSLLDSFLNNPSFLRKFKLAPAAMYIHQAYIGGLLEHTLNTAKLCKYMHALHPQLDLDLMLTGAILHDIGKIKEFIVTTNIKVSEEGMLRGHIILGEEMVMKKINHIPDFPENLRMKISHMLLSHHGDGEFGSPKKPQFAEAAAVYHADECDSKIHQYIKQKEAATTEDFRTYSKHLGEIYLR